MLGSYHIYGRSVRRAEEALKCSGGNSDADAVTELYDSQRERAMPVFGIDHSLRDRSRWLIDWSCD